MAKNYTIENYPWSLSGLKSCIKDNKLKSEIICETNSAAIVHVKSYEDSIILGADTKWCISQHDVSWKQYISDKKGIQIFIYCFNKDNKDDKSLIGFTFEVERGKVKPYCGFSRFDNPIDKVYKEEDDYTALKMGVLLPTFGNIFNELEEVIFDLYNETYCKKEKKEEKKESIDDYLSKDNYTSNDWDEGFEEEEFPGFTELPYHFSSPMNLYFYPY